MKLVIVDGNNWFRRRAETSMLRSPVRSCFYELQNNQDFVICVWDGRGGLAKRREIFPEYKVRRTPPAESIYENQDLLKKLLTLSKIVQVQVDGYEGDDVIGQLVDNYRGKFKEIFIESNDLDLYQLGCGMAREKFPEKPQFVRIMKTMVGDPSDNIPGAKGFGKGTWEKLSDEDKFKLETIIVSGHGYTDAQVKNLAEGLMPTGALNWFCQKENRASLLKMYQIVGLLPVSQELINKGTTVGTNRPDLVEPILQQYML